MQRPTKRKTINIYEDHLDDLNAIAREQGRNLKNHIEWMCEQWVKEYRKKKATQELELKS